MRKIGRSHDPGQDGETGFFEMSGNYLWAMQIAGEWQMRAVCLGAIHPFTVSRLEPEQDVTFRNYDASQFVERLPQVVRGCVNDRVPANSTSEDIRVDR